MSFISPDDVCPQCHTSRSIAPNLQLRYSTCCGFTLCLDCIQTKYFRAGSRSIICPGGCGTSINDKSFSHLNLDAQRFQKETKLRARLSKILNAEPRDFPSQRDWDDYEEFQSDIIYDITYGTKLEQERAEKRLEQYRLEHIGEIERRNRRSAMEAGESAAKEQEMSRRGLEGAMEDEGETKQTENVQSVSGGPIGSFTLPQPVATSSSSVSHSLHPTREMDHELARQPDSEAKRAEIERRNQIRRMAKLAGGMTEEIVERREREEALAMLEWLRL